MGRPPAVGDWAYICCQADLHQIVDANDLTEHVMWDGEDVWHVYHASREDALAEIARSKYRRHLHGCPATQKKSS
jgi:hypothetical protein